METVCSKTTQPDAVRDCPPMDCEFAVSSTHTLSPSCNSLDVASLQRVVGEGCHPGL